MAGGGHGGGGDGGGAVGPLIFVAFLLLGGFLAYEGLKSYGMWAAGISSSSPQRSSCREIAVSTKVQRLDDGGCKTFFIVGNEPVALPVSGIACTMADEGRDRVNYRHVGETQLYVTKKNKKGSDVMLGFMWYPKSHTMCDPDNRIWSNAEK